MLTQVKPKLTHHELSSRTRTVTSDQHQWPQTQGLAVNLRIVATTHPDSSVRPLSDRRNVVMSSWWHHDDIIRLTQQRTLTTVWGCLKKVNGSKAPPAFPAPYAWKPSIHTTSGSYTSQDQYRPLQSNSAYFNPPAPPPPPRSNQLDTEPKLVPVQLVQFGPGVSLVLSWSWCSLLLLLFYKL